MTRRQLFSISEMFWQSLESCASPSSSSFSLFPSFLKILPHIFQAVLQVLQNRKSSSLKFTFIIIWNVSTYQDCAWCTWCLDMETELRLILILQIPTSKCRRWYSRWIVSQNTIKTVVCVWYVFLEIRRIMASEPGSTNEQRKSPAAGARQVMKSILKICPAQCDGYTIHILLLFNISDPCFSEQVVEIKIFQFPK